MIKKSLLPSFLTLSIGFRFTFTPFIDKSDLTHQIQLQTIAKEALEREAKLKDRLKQGCPYYHWARVFPLAF